MTLKITAKIATLTLAACSALLPISSYAADTWPDRPIRLVVPFPPGGNTDNIARLVGNSLSQELGQPIIIENLSGASGSIGANNIAKSKPDGYNFLMGTVGTQAINMSLFKSMSEKTLDEFDAVTFITTIPNVLVVRSDYPVNSVSELIEHAKKQTNPLAYASPGVGSSIHLSGEMFETAVDIPFTHVPYRGSAPALTDLIGGQVDFMFDNLPPSLPLITAGKLKPLAVTSKERNPLLPDTPTMIELGFDNFEMGTWNGIMAPAGTPKEIINKLDQSLQSMANNPSFQEKIHAMGGSTQVKGSDEFKQFIQDEYVKWKKVIEEAGIERQ